MGGSNSLHQTSRDNTKKLGLFYDTMSQFVRHDGSNFLADCCEIRAGGFVAFDTLLEAFDMYMSNRHDDYMELRRGTSIIMNSVFKQFLKDQTGLHCYGSIVSGISLTNFPSASAM